MSTLCPDNQHPHLIDLGLPSGKKWACCNVDATSPDECGGYYAWGEKSEKSDYSWATYSHCNGTEGTCQGIGRKHQDEHYALESNYYIDGTEFDVAYSNWGGWQIPTYLEFKELFDECSGDVTYVNGELGRKITGPNGNSIFLPFGGWREGTDMHYEGDPNLWTPVGHYWTSFCMPKDNVVDNATYVSVGIDAEKGTMSYSYWNDAPRCNGYTVRPTMTPLVLEYYGSYYFDSSEHSTTETENVVCVNSIVSGSGSYTVKCSDNDLAYAWIDGNDIYLESYYDSGWVTITVTDTETGDTKSFDVEIVDEALSIWGPSESWVNVRLEDEYCVWVEGADQYETFAYSNDESVATAQMIDDCVYIYGVGLGYTTIDLFTTKGHYACIEVEVTEDGGGDIEEEEYYSPKKHEKSKKVHLKKRK